MSYIPKPEFPRPEKERKAWLNLNGEWDFMLFPVGSEENERTFSENRASYDRKIVVPFSWVSPLSGVRENKAGIGWYRRTVRYERQKRLFLCFGAVDYVADVYVNGQHAGKHQGGYSYFEFEVTELWHDGENTVEVRAEDYRRETQLYGKQGYGEIQGIWQTVWLEERPDEYIRDFRIVTKMSGLTDIEVEAVAADGATVFAEFDGQTAKGKICGGKAHLTLNFDEPKLWSPDEPYLYEGVIGLDGEGGADTVNTYFGIREIGAAEFDGRGYQWIMLNGKPIYLNGTLDQAFNPKGHFTYPSDEDMYKEAWRLKRLGLNMVRIHIKPEEPRKLYWMDKLGVLVMADIPCFWGPPVAEARAAYESEMDEIMHRDLNHPAVFAWVIFNESWGLLTNTNGKVEYLPETQDWVRSMYLRAKAIDPSRFVEDNSVCRYDHVETDINTWHFYINGYRLLRDHIRHVVDNTYPGSTFNYIGGNTQGNAPLMNSECGLVWGVDGSAGDSDLAWQYHYMLNEYRLHEKICGFVFTEFHDVVNEFNGYYRIDDTDKDFGYQAFCRGMSISDLHSADFVAINMPPVLTASAGQKLEVPIVMSSFSDKHHGKSCSLSWELWYDGACGRVTCEIGNEALPVFGYGTTELSPITVTMPDENAVAVLSLYLKDENGNVISRNFTAFDVQAELKEGQLEVPVCEGKSSGFTDVWHAMQDEKLCLGGSGEVTYDVTLPKTSKPVNEIVIHAELSSKRVLEKDKSERGANKQDADFMRGYLVDRGGFDNSYWMTDESRLPSDVEVLVNGEAVAELRLENDWCDARGVLSWHRQSNDRKLDEAGSYGEDKHIVIPSRLLRDIEKAGRLNLTFRVKGEGGLAIYGRNCGRYAHGLQLEIK